MYHFQYKKENHPKFLKSAAMGFCSKGLKNKFETVMVNEPSVLEPLKFYCTTVMCVRIGTPKVLGQG